MSNVKSNQQVVFRRVRGRVIPIRLNKEQSSNLKRGSAMVAGGYGVAALSGRVFRGFMSKANRTGQAAEHLERTFKASAPSGSQGSLFEKQFDLFDDFAPKLTKERVNKLWGTSQKALGRAAKTYGVATVVGGAIAGAGAERIYRAIKGKDAKDSVAVSASAAAAGGAIAAFQFGAYPRTTWNQAIRKATSPETIAKVKPVLKKFIKARF